MRTGQRVTLLKAILRVGVPVSAFLAGAVLITIGLATLGGREAAPAWFGWVILVASLIPISTGLLIAWIGWKYWSRVSALLSTDMITDVVVTYVLALLFALGAASLTAGSLFRLPQQLTLALACLFLIPVVAGLAWQRVWRHGRRRTGTSSSRRSEPPHK